MSLLLRPPALPLIHPQTSTLSPKLGRVNSPVLPRTSLRRFKLTAFSSSNDVDTFTQNSGYLFQLTESEAESLSEYDIAKIGSIYRKKPFILVRRLIQIVTTLGKWFGLRYVDGLMDRADSMFEIRAAELRKILVELGPAYVKIAQAISSRSDLIPPSYLEQLSVLQDRITPFSSDVAFSTIEQELGMTLDKMFSEISPEPVAAASLGQVYQARLRTNGQVVAVKVQRPGVKAAISLDIYILRFLAGIIRRARKLNTDLQAVVDEWASSLFREMDYRKEAKNGLKFRELYGGLPDVVVPHMYIEKTTPRVLIMEWIEGQKLAEVKDLYLVEVGVYCSFNQLLEYGFYHADPHPGNLLRTYDGKLAYLDFGMMGEFKEELRDGFIEACLHLVNRDFKALATDFVTLGLLPPTAEKEAVTNALTGKVLGSTYPYIAKKVLTGNSPKLVSSLQSLLYEDGVFRIDRLESLLTEMQRAKIGNALVKKDELDTRLDAKDILSFTLAKQGSFVREIFLEETAKGLDALGLATLNSITSASIASIPFTVPFLAYQMTEEDIINLRNFQRLVQLVSGSEGPRIETEKINDHQSQRSALQEIPQLLNQLPTTWELQPILASVNELPLEEQQRLYSLPTEVLARLFSRMVARTIRRYFL
ncbi:putative aarF domain-containing protein kinase At1g71810, chloroplastic isoform X2 [Silene latifolia]|uniref:putative aarF domain-containing protein kinase At1g71810, chloroplastic isoform X2 n=1 Tax=Silene latifolia TaxID=37657 RepID=UPI003D77B6D2